MENEIQKVDDQTNSNVKSNPYPMYLLIVAGQSFSKDEKQSVLDRIHSGLIGIGDSLFAVKEELNNAIRSQLFDSFNYEQEYRIVHNEKNLVVEILINSTVKSFKRALRQLFLSNLSNKYFINSTVELNTNGDLNLQDSLFSYDDFIELLNDEQIKTNFNKEAKTTLYFNHKLFEFNKNWRQIEKSHKNITFAHLSKQAASTQFPEFITEMSKFLNDTPVEQLIDSSKVIGTLRIQKPTLYIFPGREGDSAFFTINGYSMLINGGYDRVKPCFWSFVSMLQQIDSVLITHTDSDALGGLSSFFSKKLVDSDMKPTVLTVLANLIGSKQSESNGVTNSPKPKTSAQTAAALIANDLNESPKKSQSYVDMILDSIERLKIKLMPLVKSNDNLMKSNSLNSKYEHINLYYKLGQGSLDLYVLSPFANSTEFKDFVQQQQVMVAKHQKSHLSVNQLFKNIPMSHLTSAVVLLVWLPTHSKQTNDNNALRLLFTGNAPQHVVLNALDKVKDFDVLSTVTYKAKSTETTFSNGNHSAKKQNQPANQSNGVKSSANNKVAANLANINGSNGTAETNKPANIHNRTSINGAVAQKEASTAPKPVNEAKPVQATVNANKPPKAAVPTQANGSTKEKTNEKKQNNHHDNSFSKKKANGDDKEATEPKSDKIVEKKPTNGVKSNGVANGAAKKPTDTTDHKLAVKTEQPASQKQTTSNAKPDQGKTTQKLPAKPVAAKPAAPPKEQPTKKPLSIEVTNKKSRSSTAPVEVKKDPVEQSRIITKRDPKVVAKQVETAAAAASSEVIEATATVAEETVETKVDLVSATSSDCAVEPVTNGIQEEIREEENVDEIVTEQVINIELISSNLENSNEIIKENLQSQNSNLAEEREQVNTYNEWPNLSPVKKDQNGVGGDYLDENGNNSIDDGNESGLHSGDSKPNGLNLENGAAHLVDPCDLIVSPNEDKNLFSTQFETKNDIMTRSFIDDGSAANPFATASTATNRKNILDDSENDLNKTHELTDEENSELVKTEENGTDFKLNPDLLIEGIQSLTIESKLQACLGINNDYNHEPVETKANDPTTWNLLELPKPVNPNDLPAAPLVNNTNNGDKKQTPNGKKMAPTHSSLSPSNGASVNITEPTTNVVKSLVKNQSSNLKHMKPINPVYVEVSYIPAHGNSYYVDVDFFRKVRARNYILSTEDPSEHVLNSLLEAKETWDEKNLQVTIIPTYESEVMRNWFETNEENLARLKIDIMPAANYSTVTMDDNPDLSSQVYKLEF